MGNITNKRSFVARAYKNLLPDEEPDLMLKWKLIKVLRQKFNIRSRTGPKIGIHRRYGYVKQNLREDEIKDFHLHNPDVTCFHTSPPVIFEIDGDVHFLKQRAIKRTNERNHHYEQAVINGKHPKLVWLTRIEVENTEEQLALILKQKLEDQGIRINGKA
jgi:hypothetical protein